MQGIDRFSDKAKKYERYRPQYPEEALTEILRQSGIIPYTNQKVADIGSGTGKFTKLLLDRGFEVYAVEPNNEMRAIAEKKFIDNEHFNSISATSEDTTLEDRSISLITVAQAFHYFDIENTKKEFLRILKPVGKVALLWNFRLRDSEFIREYENAIYGTHSQKVNPTHAQDNMTDEIFKSFFSKYDTINIPNSQSFSFDELWGRTLSNNHAPKENEPEYQELYQKVKDLFYKYQKEGKVLFPYRTQIVVGDICKTIEKPIKENTENLNR